MSGESCYEILQLMQASNSKNSENFAERLRWFRNSRGLGQADLGKLVDRKASTISDWEKGKTEPSLKEIEILAKGLNVSPARLAFGAHSINEPRSTENDRDPSMSVRKALEVVIAAAGSDLGRLGWIREQISLHLGPPAHWKKNYSDEDELVHRAVSDEIQRRLDQEDGKSSSSRSA